MTEEKSKKNIILKILKKVKISHLIFLAILLAGNSYAWFVYISTVSTEVDVHVRSWKIDINDGDDAVVNYVDVVVDDAYPGMTTYTHDIEANNYGEMEASVSYVILSANIMGDEYITTQGRENMGSQPVATDLTSAQLESKLENDYPFTIDLDLSSSTIQAENGTATYTVTVSWPYESGDDESDTYWGNRAYEFIRDNPDDPCIAIRIKIYIQQATS
jgi:hypothetical protein